MPCWPRFQEHYRHGPSTPQHSTNAPRIASCTLPSAQWTPPVSRSPQTGPGRPDQRVHASRLRTQQAQVNPDPISEQHRGRRRGCADGIHGIDSRCHRCREGLRPDAGPVHGRQRWKSARSSPRSGQRRKSAPAVKANRRLVTRLRSHETGAGADALRRPAEGVPFLAMFCL